MSVNNSLKEIEIKLYANNQTLAKIYESSLFAKYSQPQWQQKELFNHYIDTEDHALTAAKVALRIRQDGEQYIQTLKTKGHSLGGFSERDEFDWLLETPKLNLSLLDKEHWPENLKTIDKAKLTTIFATDFSRDYALFTWQKEKATATIEVAIDKGFVKAKQKQEAISELELELREGSPEVMLDFAIELAKKFPLIPSDTSKAERGYRLIGAVNYKALLTGKPPTSDSYEAVQYYLSMSQRLLENFLWRYSKTILVSWLEHLQQLYKVLTKLEVTDLATQLNAIISDWQGALQATEQQIIGKIKQETNNNRWGVFSLSTSHWLLNHA